MGAETIVKDRRIREHLDNYAKRMRQLTANTWENDYKEYHKKSEDE
jgi:hypothetical protein